MAQIHAVKITDNIEDILLQKLIHKLPAARQTKIMRLRRKEDQLRTLIGELLIRSVICDEIEVKKPLTIGTNRYGKPHFLEYPSFHFNIAHSGEWVVGITDYLPVGIDIEKIEAVELEMGQELYTEIERRQIAETPENQKEALFYEFWALKESYIKALGKGLHIPLKSFEFIVEQESTILNKAYQNSRRYFKRYDIDRGYKMAVCTCKPQISDSVNLKDMNVLCEEFLKMQYN